MKRIGTLGAREEGYPELRIYKQKAIEEPRALWEPERQLSHSKALNSIPRTHMVAGGYQSPQAVLTHATAHVSTHTSTHTCAHAEKKPITL